MIFHAGCSKKYRSIVENGFWAGGISSRGAGQVFFSALNPQQPDSQWETDNSQDSANHSRRVLYKRGRHPDHDCISHFNLQIAQQQKQQRCHDSMREYAGLPT